MRKAPKIVVLSGSLLAIAAIAAIAQEAPKNLTSPPADAVRSDSGLVSQVMTEGTAKQHPDANDMVSVHFRGWQPDGTLFQDTYAKGKPGVFQLDRVFPGWREGIQLMVEGETRRLWIPAHLAPPKPSSGPEGAVVFDVELLAIQPIPNPPANLDDPPAGARRLSLGAYSKRLSPGTGKVTPKANEAILVHYTGWTTDGMTFDSTLLRLRPTLIPLEKVMPAFSECAQLMVAGEKRLCWVPSEVARRNWSGAPKGTLAFEVTLLDIVDPSEVFEKVPPGAVKSPAGKP